MLSLPFFTSVTFSALLWNQQVLTPALTSHRPESLDLVNFFSVGLQRISKSTGSATWKLTLEGGYLRQNRLLETEIILNSNLG